MKIILASKSPRRLELMHFLTDEFEVIPSHFPEREVRYMGDPSAYCRELALKKADFVAQTNPEDLILGSDTVVFLAGEILNKPRDRSDARTMIARMQGREHEVLTAFSILIPSRNIRLVDHVATKVRFAPMTGREIESYLDEADFMGKAGAYAIQGAAAKYVEYVEGDFYTVVGLPVARLYRELKSLGILE